MRAIPALTGRVPDDSVDRILRNHDERLRQLVQAVQAIENRLGLGGGIVVLHQTIGAASDTIRIPRTAQAPIVMVELACASAITLTSVPNIDQGLSDGQILILRRSASGSTLTLQNATVLTGSSLRLDGAANVGLTSRDTVVLAWRASTVEWWQVAARLAA